MAVYLGSNEVDILGGQTTSVTVNSLNVTSNGTYTAPSGTAYSPVSVAVSPNLITKSITQNGTYAASSDSADGYSSVTVNVGGGTLKTATATGQIGSNSSSLTFSNLSNEPSMFFIKLRYSSDPDSPYLAYGSSSSEYLYVFGATYDGTNFLCDIISTRQIATVSANALGASWSYSNGSLTFNLPFSSTYGSNTYLAQLINISSGTQVTPNYMLYYI